jgi:hypothetical protein
MKCRFCSTTLKHEFINLENAPASNSFLTNEQLNEPEVFYPLRVFVCSKCFLVQVDEYKRSDAIFTNDYVYFSSYSTSWLAHSKTYVEMMIKRFGFDSQNLVVEVASNDGYLLQYFKEKKVPVLGIEPTAGTAAVASAKGIESLIEFFGKNLAERMVKEKRQADLLLGNNVLAHVPDINDFVGGLKIALKPEGVITMEFPHLMQLVEHNQFDTIYHEHFSYLSLLSVKTIFENHGLSVFDVEELPTHGGSLRIFAKHQDNNKYAILYSVEQLLQKETSKGLNTLHYYTGFQQKVNQVKNQFLDFLLTAKKEGKKIAAYGAAAKGNTLLNYCGIKTDLIDFVADANPNKQNKFLPGSHIPVVCEEKLKIDQPDYVVVFPWNIKDEIIAQLHYIKNWNGRFVTAIPKISVY